MQSPRGGAGEPNEYPPLEETGGKAVEHTHCAVRTKSASNFNSTLFDREVTQVLMRWFRKSTHSRGN